MYDELFNDLNKTYSGDAKGEKSDITPIGMTLGVVVDTDDPLQMGRLRVFCPSLNDNPKKIHQLPWALYISPFGGSINNSGFTRGTDPSNCTTEGAVQYGFWGIPEQGAHVLVGCIDGDVRRRFWIGCAYEHQETHGVLTGRWKWEGGDGLPAGPLSSTNSPVQPLAANLKKAFTPTANILGVEVSLGSGTGSREWRTRAADYQVCGVREDIGQPPNTKKTSYLDEQYNKISQAEPDDWVKPILGAHGYDWSGYKSLGSFMASRVYGMSSPGFHSFSMDDRAFNSRIRVRTGAGHQIILDDTNERIYISTFEGKSWIELDKSGNIDAYAKRRLSLHAEEDLNLTSDATIRMLGKKGVHIYGGYNTMQDALASPPEDGEIRIQSTKDIHVITEKNYRQLSVLDTLWEVGGKVCETIGDSLYLQVQNEINILTNLGDINVTSSANYNEMVKGNANKFAEGTMTNASKGNAQMFTFDGKMDIGSQLTMNVKSMSQDVALEAVGANSGKTGGVFSKSPESQHAVTSSGITAATNKSIKHKAAENIEMNNAVPTNQDYPTPPADIGACTGGPTPPLSLDGYTGADLAARAAYNAGFRGDALATAVAIAGAESTWNPSAVGDVGLQSDKWGPSVGMWQGRTLKSPGDYTGVDAQRDINSLGGSSTTNIQNNANFAYALSNGGKNFKPWTTYTSGAYQKDQYSFESKRAANAICNPAPPPSSLETMDHQELFALSFSNPVSIIEQCLANNLLAVGNSFIMNANSVNLQSITDIAMKGALSSTKVFDGLYSKINELAFAHDFSQLMQSIIFGALAISGPAAAQVAAIPFIAQLASGLSIVQGILGGDVSGLLGSLLGVSFLESIGLNLIVGDICSYALPHFDPQPELIFFSENFAQFNSTNLGMPASIGSIPNFVLD